MIFDSHAYCFPPLDGDGGFGDDDMFRLRLQFAAAHHHQPAWRSGDRKPGDTSALFTPENWPSLDSLKEAGFRAAGHGRFEWKDGEDTYVKQWLPPSVTDMSYPADRLIAEMDYANVDMALLHRTPYLGVGNEFLADCVKQYPDRLRALAHTPEWLVPADPKTAASSIISAVNEQGLSGIQFLPPQMDLYNDEGAWDRDEFLPFWDSLVEADIPVFISLKARRAPLVDNYLAEHATLRRWISRYPDATVVLTHGLFWQAWAQPDSFQVPEELWATFEGNDLGLQLMFPIAVAPNYDYPMPQAQSVIKTCAERIGVERMMWGTDMPMVMRDWSYRQNISFIKDYCDFLGPNDMEMLFGGTIQRYLERR